MAELHGRWGGEREVMPAPALRQSKPPAPTRSVKTGRLEALLWCSMVFQQCTSREVFEERLRREIEALEDGDE